MNSSMRSIRVIVLMLLTVAAVAMAADPAGAASFTPNRPIEFVIFASPGGGSAIFAETVGGIMEKEKLVPVAVPRVYKPGGSQAVGMAYLHEKKGTPFYLGSTSNSYILAGLTGASKTIGHKDFTDIAILAFDEMVLIARQESPYKTFKDLIAAAKGKPKSIKWGGSNVGGSDSILAAMIGKATGVQFNYIAFQGGGEVNAALLGGHIDVASANPTEVMPQFEGKTMRASGPRRRGTAAGAQGRPHPEGTGHRRHLQHLPRDQCPAGHLRRCSGLLPGSGQEGHGDRRLQEVHRRQLHDREVHGRRPDPQALRQLRREHQRHPAGTWRRQEVSFAVCSPVA